MNYYLQCIVYIYIEGIQGHRNGCGLCGHGCTNTIATRGVSSTFYSLLDLVIAVEIEQSK